MILPIVGFGHAVLKKEALDIEPTFPSLNVLIENMFETMYGAKGVGLAAPQVGLGIKLFVVDASAFALEEGDEPDERAAGCDQFKKVFINPIIENESGEEWGFQEGCLSIPKIREMVYRKEQITISYSDENFKRCKETFVGYQARIIQHEYDHLKGILFTDKLSALKKKLIQNRLKNISQGLVEVDYKMKFNAIKK